MNDATDEPELPEEETPAFDFIPNESDGREIVRRTGKRGLSSTAGMSAASVLTFFFASKLIAFPVLIAACFELRSNWKWVAMTSVLDEPERRKWNNTLRSYSVLYAILALLHVLGLVRFLVDLR